MSMDKIVVICNIEHDVEPGICALCERDKAIEELEISANLLKKIQSGISARDVLKNTGYELEEK